MKNIDVIRAFVETNKPCKTKNLNFDGTHLINYNTALAQYDSETRTFYVNRTKYSVSTSKIQTYLNRELLDLKDLLGDSVTMIDIYGNVPQGTKDLKRYYEGRINHES